MAPRRAQKRLWDKHARPRGAQTLVVPVLSLTWLALGHSASENMFFASG